MIEQMNETQKHLEEIKNKIFQGRAVLFLGAGATVAAGGPSTFDLVRDIKSNFPKIKPKSDDFVEVCESVISSPYYSRDELEAFIRSKLEHLQPSEYHFGMTRYNWAAIFTTNFDDLIEESFRNSPYKPKRSCYAIVTDDFVIKKGPWVHMFKIMGTILARGKEPGRMVLSRADLNRSYVRRAKYYEHLFDFIQDGILIFVGYSGDDHIAFDIIDDVIDTYGIDSVPPSYALYPKIDRSTEGMYEFLHRKIIPVECSFQGLFEYLSKIPGPSTIEMESGLSLRVSGFPITIPADEARQFSDSFELLSESSVNEPQGDIDSFFKGINKSWGAFRERWDFIRDVYSVEGGLKTRIKKELEKKSPLDNKVLLITGIPGIGKSILLQRIAYDFYISGTPVLIFNSTKNTFDQKILDTTILEINRRYRSISGIADSRIKPIIIFDDVSSLMLNPLDVASYLASRGRAALILSASRETVWESPGEGLLVGISEQDICNVPQKLSPAENEKLVEHLTRWGYLTSREIWPDIIERELESSFFAAMYVLVDPAKRPLGQIIRDQFNDLTEEGKDVFKTICAFHRFGLPINYELLVRTCTNSNYPKFKEIAEKSKLNNIIVEDFDWEGNLLYSTHNRIIASRTTGIFLPDRKRQKELYERILSNVHFSIAKERELVEKLLIRNMGPNRNLSDFSKEDLYDLYSLVCRKEPTRSLLHHLGILETELGRFSDAEATLKRALKYHERYVEWYRGESSQNIMTSLATLYVKWAEEEEKQGHLDESERLYEQAERYLRDAIQSMFPKPHPYHVMARMYLKRGDAVKEPTKKFDYYAKALEIIDVGKSNVNPERKRLLFELEVEVHNRLQNESAVRDTIETIAKMYNSPRGYYLYARLIMKQSESLPDDKRKLMLRKALDFLEKALTRFHANVPCLRLKAEIITQLYPDDLEKRFAVLEQWANVAWPVSVDLLYDLAVTSFILEYYPTAYRRFSQLERASSGYRDRFVIKRFILDEKGKKKRFEGIIAKIVDPEEGEIRVDTLKGLDRNIRFRPMTCDFTPREGNAVSFAIGFNYVSPEAIDVRLQ